MILNGNKTDENDFAALSILGPEASNSRVNNISITGDLVGVNVEGATDVLLDQIWIHNTDSQGLSSQYHGPTSVTLRASLIENVKRTAVLNLGADVTIERSLLRGAEPERGNGGTTKGGGISADGTLTDTSTNVAVIQSLIERNSQWGLGALGANITMDSTIVRDTSPGPPNASGYLPDGYGIFVGGEKDKPGTLSIRSSAFERNHRGGIFIEDTHASIKWTTVRETLPTIDTVTDDNGKEVEALFGIGLIAQSEDEDTTLQLSESTFIHNVDSAVSISNSQAQIDSIVARGTSPGGVGKVGRGVAVWGNVATEEAHDAASDSTDKKEDRSGVWINSSVVEWNDGIGISAVASDIFIDSVFVHQTNTNAAGEFGRGLDLNIDTMAIIERSLFSRNHEAGVAAAGASAIITQSVIDHTMPDSEGFLGDGIVAVSEDVPAFVRITSTAVEMNARSGIANFGSKIEINNSSIVDNQFSVDGERYDGHDFWFDGNDTNMCVSDYEQGECIVGSANLRVPEIIAK